MNKQLRWLWGELDRWVAAGAISGEQAGRIRQFYPAPTPGLPWGMLLFSGLGAVLAGLGIILLFAYNWQAIPKFAKLGLIFLALGGAHAGGLAMLRQADWRRQLGEVLCLLGTMLFGAGIWLVAQIYHIDEHFPNGFLIWGVGALALGWALNSIPQGAIAAVLLCVWSGSEAVGFEDAVGWSPLLLAAGVGGLAWRTRSLLLVALLALGLYVILIMNATAAGGAMGFGVALSFATLLVAGSVWLKEREVFPGAGGLLAFFGYAGFLGCLYLLSFHGLANDLLHWRTDDLSSAARALHGWTVFGLAMAAWLGWLAWWGGRPARERTAFQPEWLLVPGALAAMQVLSSSVGMVEAYETEASVLFNLVLLALAGLWMARGCREGKLLPTVLGSVVLVLLATGRYFDLFESLLARGAVFLVVGAVLFAEGFFYRRARRQVPERREPA